MTDTTAQCWRHEPHASHTWTLSPEEGGADCPGIDQPAPAPTALRERYAAAIASYDHAVGHATDPAPSGHHHGQADAVLAVRDRELEQLRAQVAELIEQLRATEAAIARVREAIVERRAEVADREPDGMHPMGTPAASWCDAVAVTCARIEDALRPCPESQGICCPDTTA